MSKIFLRDLFVERLENHNITCFKCSDDDLTDFLKSDAKVQMKSKMNVTYVCIYNNSIIAYFILSSDSIKINKEDQEKDRGLNILLTLHLKLDDSLWIRNIQS